MTAIGLTERSLFALDVKDGLARPGERTLPSRYLYDELGSALFEAICALPEYGLTRADEQIIERHSPDIARLLGTGLAVAELGSGTGRKTRHLLTQLEPEAYYPIDISPAALARCQRDLSPFAPVYTIQADYLEGLDLVSARRGSRSRLLVLFLGSTIGNFDPAEAGQFVGEIRARLQPGDALLVGTDLVKDEAQLIAAYDDPLGVTAAFNKNLLVRMNRELGADFDLAAFRHLAVFNRDERRIEMHLESLHTQQVQIPACELTLTMTAGETIWTESSHKFHPAEVRQLGTANGFEPIGSWTSDEWAFAETLFLVE